MAEALKKFKVSPGFSLIELCIAIAIFGVVAKSLLYINSLSYDFLNTSLKSHKAQSINSAINVISTYLRTVIKQSILIKDNALFWVSLDKYVQGFYLPLVDLNKSSRQKLTTKFKLNEITNAFSQSAGINFSSEFKIAVVFGGVDYSVSDFGYFGNSSLALARAINDDVLEISPDYKGQISDSYTLASSAYALKFDKDSGEVWFYYNWQPWLNQSVDQAPRSLLIDGVSEASFSVGNAGIDLKICVDEVCVTELVI